MGDLPNQPFPMEHYLNVVVRLLDTVRYRDVNHTRAERQEIMHHVYTKTAEHFAQPSCQMMIQADPKVLQAAINTIVPMVVYGWAKVSVEQMADLSIQYTLMLLLDDSTDDRGSNMQSFFQDLSQGHPQKNAWWRLFNDQLPVLLKHYGPFCSLSLFRSTLDFFQGCWIDRYNFQGLAGAHDYPQFLRRLTGLGHFVGASLFPATEAREREILTQITSAMPHLEHWEMFVNDVLSFYKEFDCLDDQAILVRNYVRCGPEASIEDALDRVAADATARSEALCSVFRDNPDMDPELAATIEAFCQGYITWHLSDPRYRLRELRHLAGDSPVAKKFCEYLDAGAQAAVDAEEWAYPSIVAMAEEAQRMSGMASAADASAPRNVAMHHQDLQPVSKFIV